jgi:hypothetical protein
LQVPYDKVYTTADLDDRYLFERAVRLLHRRRFGLPSDKYRINPHADYSKLSQFTEKHVKAELLSQDTAAQQRLIEKRAYQMGPGKKVKEEDEDDLTEDQMKNPEISKRLMDILHSPLGRYKDDETNWRGQVITTRAELLAKTRPEVYQIQREADLELWLKKEAAVGKHEVNSALLKRATRALVPGRRDILYTNSKDFEETIDDITEDDILRALRPSIGRREMQIWREGAVLCFARATYMRRKAPVPDADEDMEDRPPWDPEPDFDSDEDGEGEDIGPDGGNESEEEEENGEGKKGEGKKGEGADGESESDSDSDFESEPEFA